MNQSKYENHENEGAMGGHDGFLLANVSIYFILFLIPCVQLAGTVCPRCYRRSKKASKKALAHPKDHLERSLRPIQATQVTPGPFWTKQKRLEDFRTSNENLST